MLENLRPEETPVVVFLTAFDQYAVRAFESAALDYILLIFRGEENKNLEKHFRRK